MTNDLSIATARENRISVGLFVPVSGPAGLWGPSCRACAELAADEINARGGLEGRELALSIVDSGGDPADVADAASLLLEDRDIDAIVGMHTSDVREALSQTVSGSIPYVYTPLYEGGETAPGVFCIGETPAQQLLPSLDWLCERYSANRWFLIGNDYVWPRTTNALVRHHFHRRGHAICDEVYVPFGTRDYDMLIDRVVACGTDGVLLSLVGEDAVHFNRRFSASGAAEKILRFSCAVEENILLAIGAQHTDGLFASSGYFAGLDSRKNGTFKERYHERFGERAPTLNTIGQSIYEGVHFLSALARSTAGRHWRQSRGDIQIDGVRSAVFTAAGHSASDIYLAQAAGHDFEIVKQFPPGAL